MWATGHLLFIQNTPTIAFLLTTCVDMREGNVFRCVCASVHREGAEGCIL